MTTNSARPVHPYHPAVDVKPHDGKIRFYMNDESVLSLIQEMEVPTVGPDPVFDVQNYAGSADPNTPQAMAANCVATLLSAQHMLRKYLGDNLPRWAATQILRVIPNAGSQLNAFYDRQSLKFFTGVNPITQKSVHTCLSNGTVTHEFFHSVLDSLKPRLFNSAMIEQSAAHEGFADCGAMLHAMNLDPVLTLMAQQVDAGQVSTVVSAVAPDLGYAINGVIGGLRDASVPFYYAKPESLPRIAPRDQLSREMHSYSRVLSSAFYAAVMAVYAKARTTLGTRDALIVARDVMGDALMKAAQVAPITTQYMSSLVNSILTVTASCPYAAEIASVFMKWGLATVQTESFEPQAVMPDDHHMMLGHQEVLIRERHRKITLANEIIVGSENNPLYFCQVEVPREDMLFVQSNGMATMATMSEDSEIVDQVKLGLDYIWESDLVTLHGQPVKDHHVFKVTEDGLLTRVGYNSDDGYFNNATLPGAPEFGKPWKPENNSGCCPSCKKGVDNPARPHKLGCYINERVCGTRTVRTCQVIRQKVC